jgi:hypothetical protein
MLANVARTLLHALGDALVVAGQVAADVAGRYASLLDQELPPNWQDLTYPEMQHAAALMAREGWSLAWAPGPDAIRAILAAPTRDAREAALLAAEGEIARELGDLLELIADTRLADLHRACAQALAAHAAGLVVPAQAAATAALTHAVHEHLGYAQLRDARRELRTLDPATTLPHLYRRIAVRAALGTALDRFDDRRHRSPGLPYNRNAAAHRVFAGQYRRVNSLAAVMLAVSVLVDLDLHLRAAPTPLEAALDERLLELRGTGAGLRRPVAS